MSYIAVDHVWKQFLLRTDRSDSVGQLLFRMLPGRRRPSDRQPFWALQDVAFEVPPGVSLGVVGNNGSGKSTLLKILTRTMQPSRGTIRVEGRVSALIELGAGFHPDFTGRENVFLNASILGFTRREIEHRLTDIIAFSELEQFIDTPIKYYSSGMHARLGFSVATAVDPEILIVDEVLAVGDENFSQKCMDRIFRMKHQGVSILLVSHDLSSVERLMDQAVWINQGHLMASGKPADVVQQYREFNLASGQLNDTSSDTAAEPGERVPPVEVVACDVRGHAHGDGAIATGDAADIEIVLENRSDEEDLQISIGIRIPDGMHVVQLSTLKDGVAVHCPPGERCRVRCRLESVWLVSGTYDLDVDCYTREGRRLSTQRAVGRLTVKSLSSEAGLLVVPHSWYI